MNFSKYQLVIFDFFKRHANKNFVIKARSGAGKTFSMLELAKRIPLSKRVIFVCFNKHIAEELREKLPEHVKVTTVHALGFGMLNKHFGKVQLNNSKYRDLCYSHAASLLPFFKASYDLNEISDFIHQVVSLVHVTLLNYKDADRFAKFLDFYGLDKECGAEELRRVVNIIIDKGIAITRDEKIISYSDMIYMPYVFKCWWFPYDYVFGDEIQDWGAGQLNIIKKLFHPDNKNKKTRFIGAGDPNQAIASFAGGMVNSFEKVKEVFKCDELPLPMSYRCAKSIVNSAKEIIPDFEHLPDADEGEIREISNREMIRLAQPKDLIISRLNAPLITTAMSLIVEGTPVILKKIDVLDELLKVLNKIEKYPNFKMEESEYFLDNYYELQSRRLLGMPNEKFLLELLKDKIDCLRSLFVMLNCKSITELKERLKNIFDNDKKYGVLLSSIHAIKGGEAENVFIINPEKLPLVMSGMKPWQYKQEINLKYVAITRAKKKLYWVRSDK